MPNSIATHTQSTRQEIDLSCPLSLRTAFRFPLQSSLSRSEIIQGGLWLFVPGIGWLLNMGHRIVMVHRMQHGLPAWPAWTDYGALFRHGVITFLGMAEYHAPAVICGFLAWRFSVGWLYVVAVLLWVVATIAVPGYMSHYCFEFDAQEVFNPFRALSRVFQGRMAYWRAWSAALTALALSFTGLFAFGVGFLFTSVWFWQVAAFSFATVFTQSFGLTHGESGTR